jgi:LPXTG-site transpeptidase (sortase) family protein
MNLRRFNHALTGLIALVGFYIILSPFMPTVQLWLADSSPESRAPYAGALAALESSSASAAPDGNRLVIPSILLNEPIYESNTINAIADGGTWRRPASSTPFEPGNTVIVGHRFFGRNVSTFYHLEKVTAGEKIAVYWEDKEMIYQVEEVKVVSPEAVDIESRTKDTRLTLYTCTPIWTARERLVVIARPVDKIEDRGMEIIE